MDPVRVGVIGTSWFTDFMHLPNLKSHPGADVAAICGRNRARAEELAARYSIPNVFCDYHDMILHGGLQALIVVVPDDLHYPITMEALDAGLHVLCEKPLAMSAPQARAMYEKAESRGLKHMRATEQSWRQDGRRTNGVLGDLGSHMIDLARLLVGDITGVCGRVASAAEMNGGKRSPIPPANDSAMVLLDFAGGAHGMIQASAVTHMADRIQEQQVILTGEKGTLEIDVVANAGMEIRGARSGELELKVLPIPDGYWENVDRKKTVFESIPALFQSQSIGTRLFIDSIAGDLPAVPGFREGYLAQAIVDAVLVSHDKGCWVSP